ANIVALAAARSERRGGVSLFVLIRNRGPGLVRVEALHFREHVEGLWTEIFFVNNTVVADDESFYSGHSVLGWGSDQSEAADHHPFDNEIHFAERGSGSLSL